LTKITRSRESLSGRPRPSNLSRDSPPCAAGCPHGTYVNGPNQV